MFPNQRQPRQNQPIVLPNGSTAVAEGTHELRMLSQTSGIYRLRALLITIEAKQLSGVLSLTEHQNTWFLPFYRGQLGYPICEVHRVRRWSRAIKRSCPQFRPSRIRIELASPTEVRFWEQLTLARGLKDEEINLEQARDTVRTAVKEMLFSAASMSAAEFNWQPVAILDREVAEQLTLQQCEVQALMQVAEQLWQRWQLLGLDLSYSNRAPILKEVGASSVEVPIDESTSFHNLQPLFNGQRTFWDIDVKLQQSSMVAIRLLKYFLQQNAVDFRVLADLPNPLAALVAPTGPLIACIDDSLVVCRVLEEIVTHAGYRFISTQDPVESIPLLRKHRPDFVFLDLNMPVVNGYEVCTQIRRIEGFRETPVTILTGQDGLVDRVRAKLAGSTDFMAKPPREDKIVAMLEKYLGDRKTPIPNQNTVVPPLG
jgi:chemotaxis family two-component system response regulator PixG